MAKETHRATVPAKAKQAGKIRDRWPWVEPSVWTDRMLTALEEGVKGGCWFSLIDKVYAQANLHSAACEVKRNGGAAGIDHESVTHFDTHRDKNLEELAYGLKRGDYHPQAVRRVWIPKPGSAEKRPLGIPTVRDRIVQAAIRHVLEPIFEHEFAEHSYGFRPQRSCKDALRQVDRLLKAGQTYVVDADLKSYFDSIPHDRLMDRLREKIADGRVLELVEAFLNQQVIEEMQAWSPERGTPQGAVLSPLLANIYLDPLDHHLARQGYEMVRYADDFVILCRTEQEARHALAQVEQWTTANGLQLHPTKTRIVDATQRGGFEFLGYHFERGYRWPRKKSIQKLKDSVREKTKRTNGTSLECIIADLNPVLRGWFEYFKHSHPWTFRPLDAWTRMRLRSILRKRHKGHGRGRGLDHVRWPNAFFARLGLFSMVAVRAAAGQSSAR